MSLVETIVAAAKPWADVYAASKPLSTTFTFAHIASPVSYTHLRAHET